MANPRENNAKNAKFEYRVVNDHNPDSAEQELNRLGDQGWELVAVVYCDGPLLHFLKKKI